MKDSFYIQLQAVVDGILGGMNTNVGPRLSGDNDIVGAHGAGVRNDNSPRLVDLSQRNALVNGGTIFVHRDVHKGT